MADRRERPLDLRTLRRVEEELRGQAGGYRSDTVRGGAIHGFVDSFLLHWIGGQKDQAVEAKKRRAARRG